MSVCLSKRWFVCRTQTNREEWAAENVTRQGCDYYMPRVAVRGRRSRLMRCEPLFRSYLFVATTGQWRFLLGTFGVVGIVMGTNGVPANMRESEIAALRKREDKDGLVELPQKPKHQLQPNTKVRIRGGVFMNQTGLFEGQASGDRVKVLMAVLGSMRSVLMPAHQVEAVAE